MTETDTCHPLQHSSHVYKFWNAPLSQRRAWTLAKIAELEAELASPSSRSPDAYYGIKDRIREYSAELNGKTAIQHDPMGFWFGRMSN